MNQAALRVLNSARPMHQALKNLNLVTADKMRRVRRLMLGTEGLTNTGKTEFLLSAPGPNVILPLDSSYDGVLDNPNPPMERRLHDAAFDNTLTIPLIGTELQANYAKYFTAYRARLYAIIGVPEIRTVCIDGETDSWELQLLAEFGRLSQIHPLSYPMADGTRRAMVKKLWESSKIIIATHKLKDKYEDVKDDEGNTIVDDKGKAVQRKVVGQYKRQGFRDQNYLWQIQIRHLYKPGEIIDPSTLSPIERLKDKREVKPGKTLPQWGLAIMKCKPNPRLEGDELWGDDCNFKGLVRYIYPQIPLTEWGFETDE